MITPNHIPTCGYYKAISPILDPVGHNNRFAGSHIGRDRHGLGKSLKLLTLGVEAGPLALILYYLQRPVARDRVRENDVIPARRPIGCNKTWTAGKRQHSGITARSLNTITVYGCAAGVFQVTVETDNRIITCSSVPGSGYKLVR